MKAKLGGGSVERGPKEGGNLRIKDGTMTWRSEVMQRKNGGEWRENEGVSGG